MEGFFQGLEHSSAFAFVQNETGEFVRRKRTDYQLYEGNIYPFVEFGDQLRALNDYCFLVAQTVQEELLEKQSQAKAVRRRSCAGSHLLPAQNCCWEWKGSRHSGNGQPASPRHIW